MRQVGSEFVITVLDFFSTLGPTGQFWCLVIQMGIFYALTALALKSLFTEEKPLKPQSSRDPGFVLLLFFFVFVSRFPDVIYGYQNPDEGVWLACAKALLSDPRPWVAADTTTSGPLVLLPLFLLRLVGLPLDFGSIKIAAGVVMGVTLVFTYKAFFHLFGISVARIAIVTTSVAVSLTNYWDFITYNGEHMPLLLLSISLFLLSRELIRHENSFSNFLIAGFLLGMIPFAKLQSVPLALLVALAGFGILLQKYRRKHFFYFAAAGLVPTLLMLAWISAGGGLSHFWNSYILFNMSYATSEAPADVSILDKIALAWHMIFTPGDLTPYFQAALAICLFCLIAMNYRGLTKSKTPLYVTVFGILYFLLSLYCIGQPYRTFAHYTYFAYFTLSLLMACLLSAFKTNIPNGGSLSRISFCIILFIATFLFHQKFTFHPAYNTYANVFREKAVYMPEVIRAINENSVRGDRIAVWGWNNIFYGETDLIMGSRYTDIAGIVTPGFMQDYFVELYMSDLKKNKPRIFLDAINRQGMKFQYRSDFGFDKFPVVKRFVDSNYRKVAEIDDFHIYVRR